jgi:nitrile hydratase
VHPPFPFPDTVAHGLGEDPEPLYGVTFRASTLWGEGDHSVTLDLFEPYLEAA